MWNSRASAGMKWGVPGCWLAFVGIICSAALAQHGVHPLMPGQDLVVRCRLLDAQPPKTLEKSLPAGAVETQLGEVLPIAADGAAIRMGKYLPHAVLEQHVVPATEAAPPAVRLVIQGPTQSFERWLMAGDPERNRLTSFIGTWRYMSVKDEQERGGLLGEFEKELTREPRLIVRRSGEPEKSYVVPAGDATETVAELGLRVRTKRFLPDARVQGSGAEPVNQSERRKNPAVQVELEHDGVRESRWVFAKFPEFGPREDNRLGFDVTLDCPVEGPPGIPDFALVTVGSDINEVWMRLDSKITTHRMNIEDETKIPGSQYVFAVKDFVPAAQMIEAYTADPKDKAVPAIELEYPATGGAKKVWVGLRQYRTVETTLGRAVLSLEVASKEPSLGHP